MSAVFRTFNLAPSTRKHRMSAFKRVIAQLGATGKTGLTEKGTSSNYLCKMIDFRMDSLVDDVLIQIFLRLTDPKCLIITCPAVCRRWANILNRRAHFWKTKCKFDHRTVPLALLRAEPVEEGNTVDYLLIWLKNPYGRNMIKNDSGQERFKYWDIKPARWDGEQTIIGGGVMNPIEKHPPLADGIDVSTCFITSYFQCMKTQVVDLWAEGVQPWILAQLKPVISVSEWHAARRDCGSTYEIRVVLLDSDKSEVGTPFTDQSRIAQWEGGTWEQSLHKFTDYPVGVRYVSFSSCGSDTQFWAGFFGAKMAKASVTVGFE